MVAMFSRSPSWASIALSKLLPVRLQRVARFGLAGLASTFFFFIVANALVMWGGVEPVSASVTAYVTALALSYALQSRFTFRVEKDSPHQILRFLLTATAGLAIAYVVTAVVGKILHWPYVIGTLTVSFCIPVANYIVFSLWVFKRAAREESEYGSIDQAETES